MKKNILQYLLLIITISLISCRQVHVYEGEVEVLDKTIDRSLNDSVMVYGKVLSAIDRNALYYMESRIWIVETGDETFSDNYNGEYSLKLPIGEYTINCLGKLFDESDVLVARGIFLQENEKIEINFYLEGTVE